MGILQPEGVEHMSFTSRSTGAAKKPGRTKLRLVAITALVINLAISILVVVSGGEIIQAVFGLFNAEVNEVGAFTASSILLGGFTFLFLCFFEFVLGFILLIFASIFREAKIF